MAERVVVDPAGPAIAANAAAASASTAIGAALTPPLAGGAVNEFDAALAAFHTWGHTVHQGVAGTTRSRGQTIGSVSAAGFAALTEMDTANAGDLGEVGQAI